MSFYLELFHRYGVLKMYTFLAHLVYRINRSFTVPVYSCEHALVTSQSTKQRELCSALLRWLLASIKRWQKEATWEHKATWFWRSCYVRVSFILSLCLLRNSWTHLHKNFGANISQQW